MTAMGVPANAKRLAALVKEGEGPALEFKRSTGELKEGMQTLQAFLNGSGVRPEGTNRVIALCRKHGAASPIFKERQGFLVVTFKTRLVADKTTEAGRALHLLRTDPQTENNRRKE